MLLRINTASTATVAAKRGANRPRPLSHKCASRTTCHIAVLPQTPGFAPGPTFPPARRLDIANILQVCPICLQHTSYEFVHSSFSAALLCTLVWYTWYSMQGVPSEW